MKKYLSCLFIFLFLCDVLHSKEISYESDPELYGLYEIAIKNINFSSSIPEDSIVNICGKLKEKYQSNKDADIVYGIMEIEINSLCLKGDIGLAINKANIMYEEAKQKQNQLGIGLAFQAIGETYLHSNRLTQANKSFQEAARYIQEAKDSYAQLRLLIQQLYVCMELGDMPQLQQNIARAIEMSHSIPEPFRDDLNFYISCYQTLHAMESSEFDLAEVYLNKTMKMGFINNHYDVWKFYISSRYYELIQQYKQALLYNESALRYLKFRNPNSYIKFSVQRARLCEKCNELKRACNIYAQINSLSDSLNVTQYASQIDSLRVTYWVDPLNIEHAVSYNRMLSLIMLYGGIILVVMLGLIGITRSKNRQLRESQKRLSEKRYEASDAIQSKSLFLSNMSHELRTPLSTIVSFSRLLAEHYEDDVINAELKQQCAEIINKNSDLLFRRLNDITDISDLREKQFNFTWGELDVVALCRGVINSVDKADKESIKIQFKTKLENLVIETDFARLRQVLVNLLENAVQFTSKGSIILEISLLKDKGEDAVQFTVEDTGCGIPLDKHASIFQRLENLHEEKQGIGWGLSICLLLVTHLGGKIWLDSSYKGGSRFVFTHPVKRKSLGNISATDRL